MARGIRGLFYGPLGMGRGIFYRLLMTRVCVNFRKLGTILTGFLLGAALLCVISMIQKMIAHYDPWTLKGYIVPLLFGGSSGGVIVYYCFKVRALNRALVKRVNRLESFLLICAGCKKIREPGSDSRDPHSWQEIESYISDRTASQFSHGICPDCIEKWYGAEYVPKRP